MVTIRAICVFCPDAATTTSSPLFHAAGSDRAGKATKIQMRSIDPLHREPQRLLGESVLDIDRFEMGNQGRPFIPGHIRATAWKSLSPNRAEIGIGVTALKFNEAAK